MRSLADNDLSELSARIESAKKLNPMQKVMAWESIMLVLCRVVERLAGRVDELEGTNE